MIELNDSFENEYDENHIEIPLDTDNLVNLISTGGAMDCLTANFEQRDAQIELLKKICQSFNEDKIGVFEAGTGVGKSFAYLIPAIIWAKQNKERIVISTGTINLQQQIFLQQTQLNRKPFHPKGQYIHHILPVFQLL